MSLISTKEKKKICNMIKTLSKTEHDEIFKLLQYNSYTYTQNNNGIFMNFSTISDEDFNKVKDFVLFCYDNKESLDEYDKKMIECKSQSVIQKVSNPTSLKNIIKMCDNADELSIQDLVNTCKNKEKIETFMSMLDNKTSTFFVNKSNCKYMNAKKKFAKKAVLDKKNDIAIMCDLTPDTPILHREVQTI